MAALERSAPVCERDCLPSSNPSLQISSSGENLLAPVDEPALTFRATRVTKLGVGAKVPSFRPDDIASALMQATSDRVMVEKAARIGARIRAENGLDNALRAICLNIRRAARDRTKIHWGKE